MIKKIIIGLIAGIISGLFSTGGGMILVPSFIYLLKMDDVKSRATANTCILPMVIVTTFLYAKNQYLDFRLGIRVAIGGIIGGIIGSKLLNKIPKFALKITFIIFITYVAITMIGI